jgi:hypothetical protein
LEGLPDRDRIARYPSSGLDYGHITVLWQSVDRSEYADQVGPMQKRSSRLSSID